jgi:mono/diheme cytochrome c family protein
LGDGPSAAQLPEGATALADPSIARSATPAEWFEVVKEGRMDLMMPPWKNRLTDEEIWDVVSFSFTLHTSDEEIRRGAEVWEQECAVCHGEQGAGNGPQALAAQWQMADLSDLDYTAQQSLDGWFQVVSGGRSAMPAFGDSLEESDIRAAVQYARTFSYRPLIGASLPEGQGKLVGQVINATPGSENVNALTVTLRAFQGFDELRTEDALTGEDGSFLFEGLPTESDFLYLVTAEYGDTTFASELVGFTEGNSELPLSLEIWESSTTPGTIDVNLAQWFIEYHQGALLVGELYRITHDSDTVYIGEEPVSGDQRAVLQFELPAGATAVTFDGGEVGERYILTRDGVVDTQPLPPGQVQVLMRYLLPYEGTRAELAHSIPYPVEQMSVLVAEGLQVRSDLLEEAGQRTVSDRQFMNYEASNLPARQPVSLQLRGLERTDNPAAPASSSNSTAILAYHPVLVYGVGLLAAGLLLALLAVPLLLNRQQNSEPASTQPEQSGTDLRTERERLLLAIADLDDQYEAGQLDENAYQRRRLANKRNLVQITRQLEANPASDAGAKDGGEDQELSSR